MSKHVLRTVSAGYVDAHSTRCPRCGGTHGRPAGAPQPPAPAVRADIAATLAYVRRFERENGLPVGPVARPVAAASADEIAPTPSIAALQRAQYLAAERAKDLTPAGHVPAALTAGDDGGIPPTASIAAVHRARFLAEARSRIKEVL